MTLVRGLRRHWVALAMLSPSIILVGIFVYGFIGWSLRVSVSEWQGLRPDFTFAGLDNFVALLSDRRFQIDMRNTVVFTTFFVVGAVGLGLLLAILIDRRVPGETFFRNVFLFPLAISLIVTGVAWRWLMNPGSGERLTGLNLLFDIFGLNALISAWHTSDPPWGIAFVALPAVWQMSGFTMALFLGGLRAIPDELKEAARVDGAGEFQVYRRIIIPLLRPALLSALIILGHLSLKVFDLIVALSGKDLRLDVPAIYMWTTTFDAHNYARGASIGIYLLLSVAILVVPYLLWSLRRETEL
ncbi:MAG TPA: sugar ABC transporter permease [Candidatus Limnocylindrales bacterium]|jgi:glucose/mannose transport system permease protein|nr:sugar ABC transporter permease [Candidatus Limnocylindrales bacterium]